MMMNYQRRRWSDNDKNLGPFTYARECRTYHSLAIVLNSGDDEDYPGCSLRFSGFRHTLIVALPPIIQPWRRKVVVTSWDAETVARLGRNWYFDTHSREYGFSYSEGFLNVFLGRQTHDSSTEQRWSKFLPWTEWRHVRHSLYDLSGSHFWTEPKGGNRLGEIREYIDMRDTCPSRTFAFADFDGEDLTARTVIEEREWRFGAGWFKWLSMFRKPKIRRSLDIQFSGETGKRKGSWKGGTIGHSINMLPGELHEAAFRRYCLEHSMTFIGIDENKTGPEMATKAPK